MDNTKTTAPKFLIETFNPITGKWQKWSWSKNEARAQAEAIEAAAYTKREARVVPK